MTRDALPDDVKTVGGQEQPSSLGSGMRDRPEVRSSRKGQIRRAQILSVAIRLIARNGGRGTSLAQIAHEAGVTQQGLLHYFSSKDELLNAALDVRDERDAVERATPWQGLAFLDAIVERVSGWRAEPEMIGMFTMMLIENLGDNAPLRERLTSRYDQVRRSYAEGVRTAQANGTARPDIDPDLKAIEVIAFLNGLETSWLLEPSIPAAEVAITWRNAQLQQMTPKQSK